MRLQLPLFLSFSLLTCIAYGQRSTVTYDFARNTFGEFEDLPSEMDLLIKGALPPATELVEINVYDKEVKKGDELYSGFWTAAGTTGAKEFAVPVNYQLSPGRDYTFRINFFGTITSAARTELYRQVRSNIESYLNLNYEVQEDGEIELKESARKVRRELDQIVLQSMSQYRITSPGAFRGFSDLVLEQLDQLDGYKATVGGSSQDSLARAQVNGGVSRTSPLTSLMNLIDGELRSILNQDIVMLRTERVVSDYRAEDKPGYFSIVAGYGAVYYDGNLDNLDYDAQPFIGLGFPLAQTKVAPKVFRNASVSVGVFLKNFDIENTTYTGPIVKRPLFLGLDYKLFQFVRFNAGATFLEAEGDDDGDFENLGSRVQVRPFIGLSAKLNLRVSLDK